MPTPTLTFEELIATLKRSRLATVLVEGDTDTVVFRWINELLGDPNDVDVLPCTGRDNLLKVFAAKSDLAGKKLAFLADKDMWVFGTVPSEYSEIVWTEGYSIENDIYAGSNLHALLTKAETARFTELIHEVGRCFAFEVEQSIKGSPVSNVASDLGILEPGTDRLSSKHLKTIGFVDPSSSVINDVRENFAFKLRGRLVFSCLLRIFHAHERRSSYGRIDLLEIGFKMTKDHVYRDRIVRELANRLQITVPPPSLLPPMMESGHLD